MIVRDIEPEDARDLLTRVPRAALGFVGSAGPVCEPAALRFENEAYVVGLRADADPVPADGDEVVLVVDEGVQFFDLRAIYVRGHAEPVRAPSGAGGQWFEIEPTKIVAWDYGRIRSTSWR